ncbi:MAG: hypothetical protein KIT84_06270 [Labilithrix sp.]|nr:hypothetical protein [Labilithrix sp.]MCW5810597.1 hypothetical protein [Labilithrix sp.]
MLAPLKRLALAAFLLAACDDKPKEAPSEPPPPKAEIPGLDAGLLGEGQLAIDPPAPPGDLKAELDRFVNLDTCVNERAKLDPLVGDAIGAIGYDTLLRDACRLLEAAKDKKRETCDAIGPASLRRQCVSWIAMIAEAPDQCPLQFEALPARGRVASCVAIAARDQRLCAAEPLASARATCEALVLRDPKHCEVLLPNPRASCVRELTRWRNVLATPLEGLEKLPATRATLTLALPSDAGVEAGAGTDAGVVPETDIGELVAQGVVLVTARERTRIELGSLIESETSRIAAIPQKRARVAAALLGDGKRATVQKLELVLPADAPFVSPPAACDCKVTRFEAEPKRGAPVSFRVEGTITNGIRQQPFTIDVTTWARDVTSTPGALPPAPRSQP